MINTQCSHCGRTTGYTRIKTQEFICRACGGATPIAEGLVAKARKHDPAMLIREKILEMAHAGEMQGVALGSTLMFRRINAACGYKGPIEAVLGQMKEEGLVDQWSTGRQGVVYMNTTRLHEMFPELPPFEDGPSAPRASVGEAEIAPEGDF